MRHRRPQMTMRLHFHLRLLGRCGKGSYQNRLKSPLKNRGDFNHFGGCAEDFLGFAVRVGRYIPMSLSSIGGNHRSLPERWFCMPIASIRFTCPFCIELSRKFTKLAQACFVIWATLSISSLFGYADDVIYWSKSEFTIPFHVDQNGQLPAEVQLESSADFGTTWNLHARGDLKSRQFRFVSKEDGLVWFRIKTVDESGKTFDPGGAPLKVMVDTKSPDLSLSVDTNDRGDMEARFIVRDANPIATGLRLEYQTEHDQRWITIPFTTAEGLTEMNGSGTWVMPAAARQLVVRLIARDAAGNESEITRLPQVPKTAFGRGGLQLASGKPNPSFTQSYPTSKHPNPSVPTTPPNSLATKVANDLATPPSSNATQYRSNGSPAASSSTSQQNSAGLQTTTTPAATPISSASPYQLRSLDEIKSQSKRGDDEALYLDGATAPSSSNREVSNDKPYSAEPSLASDSAGQALTEKPFYSSSKAFSLDYSVDSPAASPIAAVELWGTADGGKIWERWGTDPDGVSPFDIKVETEGLFGFRMVIVGANGLAGNRPRNGDNADAWIHVDTEIPTARINSAQYGKGTEAGSMVVEYTARDRFFGERPISLSYSELPSGPWVTIANGLRNTGRYVWISDPNLPTRVYLKIEAHDEAGNIGEHRMDVPIDIAGLAPRGRIQGFRPITN
jgi:hypothetical protein